MTAPPDNPPVPGQLGLDDADDLAAEERELAEQQRQLAARIDAARSTALDSITAAAQRKRGADEELTLAVARARAAGVTWEKIAAAAGITRQSAWQRWA